jgi:quinohemoprotein ethanol dehydrogenase
MRRASVAETDGRDWPSHGRTYSEQRYSPLTQINDGNVARLGLAWTQTLDYERGVETTPIVVDGVMYATGPWSLVYAFAADTGKPLWKFDPQVDRERSIRACCGPVNRGVAVWQGKVYVGALDGRLIALDARDGKPVWSVQTFIDLTRSYTITGAPRVVKGKVLIGNGGAELGVRGYVSAYDAGSGKLKWRFFTVPGDPGKPFESPAMAMAAKTWSGDQWWTWGGGGTVWDAMSYDPELDLLYIGVGNGSPWSRNKRSPGGGDNLFLSSVVALRPDSGEYVWHFQLAPGEQWDYPATAQMVLADLPVDGVRRKVLIQVPKHGFVYVLDRKTGKLLRPTKFTKVTWATGYDLKTGRPRKPRRRTTPARASRPCSTQACSAAITEPDRLQPEHRPGLLRRVAGAPSMRWITMPPSAAATAASTWPRISRPWSAPRNCRRRSSGSDAAR